MVWLVDKEPLRQACQDPNFISAGGFWSISVWKRQDGGRGSDSTEDRLLGDIHTHAHGHREDQRACGPSSPVVLSWHLASCVSYNTQYMHIHSWVSDLEGLPKPRINIHKKPLMKHSCSGLATALWHWNNDQRLPGFSLRWTGIILTNTTMGDSPKKDVPQELSSIKTKTNKKKQDCIPLFCTQHKNSWLYFFGSALFEFGVVRMFSTVSMGSMVDQWRILPAEWWMGSWLNSWLVDNDRSSQPLGWRGWQLLETKQQKEEMPRNYPLGQFKEQPPNSSTVQKHSKEINVRLFEGKKKYTRFPSPHVSFSHYLECAQVCLELVKSWT